MARQQGWFALILALAIAAAAVLSSFPLQLGLDLRGGSQLTLEVQPAGEITTIGAEQMEAVKAVLDRRVNGLGVAESTLQTVGDDQLVLQLPGVTDPTRAADVLGSTALLEFRAQKEGTQEEVQSLRQLRGQLQSVLATRTEDEASELDPEQQQELANRQKELGLDGTAKTETDQLQQLLAKTNREILDRFEPTAFTGKQLISAGRQQQQNGSGWEVTLNFNAEGGEKFAELTQSIAGTGRLLGIVLDGELISEASVGPQYKAAGISGGTASISGNFTAEDARDLEVQLRGGSLPLPVEILEVRTIGPSLGAENVRRSLIAALSGLVLVGIFMLLIYRLAGAVAVMALSLYALFNLAVYALIPVTLTLPGIAGFILSIGMAVDANVLIFERIKDELRRGNTLIRSIETGFSEAFSSIVDGHLTTLISCAALFFLGTGLVKGFAATLGIGVLLSLFTALTCTRTLLRFLMSYQGLRRPTNFLPARQLPKTAS
ncbi:Protein translocase subunit SecD [Synechococcus sp. MIT S9509]|uniref:protein translocase subunit SecD n=1 Tax=unclassified Synechococcus TaxID=2626047 RepID=UPI0007BB87C6|nr:MULTISPECIES: protein translocase subunit SecD [unclassified Synechococcus]KZR87295.1 Protein translocase subunit SecD [Synechococcus sp. MIT S9504]KZR92696.1 Protein translocase subunit SecD [Synechococcus sp. MIT S9509]